MRISENIIAESRLYLLIGCNVISELSLLFKHNLTKSLLLKSVVEASIIEPVQRHLPNVHGKNKFSHFSQDRVITSFGGGLDFKNYKPL